MIGGSKYGHQGVEISVAMQQSEMLVVSFIAVMLIEFLKGYMITCKIFMYICYSLCGFIDLMHFL